ncbi:virion structural protein [Thiohalocapsa phage LS06-2018-MD03]|nr:virion structural protein [Thiohalocapsa phage LS06-2018-MD03]
MPLVLETHELDNLVVDLRLARKITVTDGQTLVRGDLVELVAGKAVAFNGNDPYAVMLEDVTASGSDVVAFASWDATLKGSEVDFKSGSDSITVRDALAVNGTYLVD